MEPFNTRHVASGCDFVTATFDWRRAKFGDFDQGRKRMDIVGIHFDSESDLGIAMMLVMG